MKSARSSICPSDAMDGGEETALLQESLGTLDSSLVKAQDGSFCIVSGEFETSQEAEENA